MLFLPEVNLPPAVVDLLKINSHEYNTRIRNTYKELLYIRFHGQ